MEKLFFNEIVKRLPSEVVQVVPSKTPISVTFLNPFSFLIASKQNIEIYKSFDYICFDGISLIWLSKLFLKLDTPRISFDMTSLAPLIFNELNEKGKSVFFIGSTINNITKFIETFRKYYSKVNIIGYRDGYFKADEKEVFYKEIVRLKPSVVVVGMGTPYQDIMISELKKRLPDSFFYSCGGFFHQSVDDVYYYPKWVDRYNLRWLYRIYDEPALLRRYLIYYPYSILLFIIESFKRKKYV